MSLCFSSKTSTVDSRLVLINALFVSCDLDECKIAKSLVDGRRG